MLDTADDLAELGVILDDAGSEICAAGDICSDIADKIHAALVDANEVPSCNYEDFVAICEECGADITVDSDYEIDDNGHTLCEECSALYKGLTNGEQTTMDIPETVTAQ
jgi:predicted nucleic acid-binding Zn ribbon protein